MAKRWRSVFLALLAVTLIAPPGAVTAHGGSGYRAPGPDPTTPPATTPPPPPRPPPGPPTHARPVSFADWVFWWHHNTDRLEAEVAPRAWVLPEGKTAKLHADVVACLRKAIGVRAPSGSHVAIRSNALLTLARTTGDVTDVDLLVSVLEDPARDLQEQQAAALGLGLLRRSAPERRFPPAVYSRARKVLLRAFENGALGAGTRAFAMLGIALLGDQPFGEAYPVLPGSVASAEDVVRKLEQFLLVRQDSTDLGIALLMALGRQASARPSPPMMEQLRRVVSKGRTPEGTWHEVLRSHAALTLGRVGGAEDISVFLRVIAARAGMPRNVRRSSAIALGLLAPRLGPEDRKKAMAVARRLRSGHRDASTAHFLTMALVPLTAATDRVTTQALLESARRGKSIKKPYAALALGLLARAFAHGPPTKETATFHKKVLGVLEKGLRSKRNDATVRAAFAVALPLLGDPDTPARLAALVRDEAEDPLVRHYALVGLALHPGKAPVRKLAQQLALARIPHDGHVLHYRVLALTPGMPDVALATRLPSLLTSARSGSAKADAAIALARCGTEEGIRWLMRCVADPREQDLTRALAVVGLDRATDPEPTSSILRLTEGQNHRCMTDLMNALLSLY